MWRRALRIMRMPPRTVAAKVLKRLRDMREAHREKVRILRTPTYALDQAALRLASRPLHRCFGPPAEQTLRQRSHILCELARRFVSHRFDLLGSGWITVDHQLKAAGVDGHVYCPESRPVPDAAGKWLATEINRTNLPEARRIWKLIEQPYQAIDWHVDFKSGYRWLPSTWAPEVKYGVHPGVDVKVPWELSRCQHLPLLAQACSLAAYEGTLGELTPERLLREFQNQVLDFIATNPPGYGVNWLCTMDVAIRIANWLVAYDILRASGAVFDERFEHVFRRSTVEHGRHIVTHLEWSDLVRANHYLADVVGLLFAAGWLDRSPETDAWLAFAVHELTLETQLQFDGDGAGFEASTSYHRLSAEMVVYGTAAVLALPGEKRAAIATEGTAGLAFPRNLPPGGLSPSMPFSAEHWSRIEGMARFSAQCTGADGRIVQTGDNDSGRFLKLSIACDHALMQEDVLDHRSLRGAIAGLLGGPLPIEEPGTRSEYEIIQQAAGTQEGPPRHRGVRETSTRDSEFTAFRTFGLYVYRQKGMFTTVRCGRIGQNGNGGHAHNDQLSITIEVDGQPVIVDPGTGIYTPLPAVRNRFRSTASHNTLAVPGREQQRWNPGLQGLFNLQTDSRATCLEATGKRFSGEHHGYGVPHRRTLEFDQRSIRGTDEYTATGPRGIWFHLAPGLNAEIDGGRVIISGESTPPCQLETSGGLWQICDSEVSAGYGLRTPAKSLVLNTEEPIISWCFTAT